jgi:hypothetical protein
MGKPRAKPLETPPVLPPPPGWIMSGSTESLEVAAFRSGAALAHLATVTADPALPQALWRDRLALAAAGSCAAMAGRREGQGALRDALHLTGPGDDRGSAAGVGRASGRNAAGDSGTADRTLP